MTADGAQTLDDPALHDIPLHDGGTLRVAVWHEDLLPESGPRTAILAVHGLTMSHRTWTAIASRLPGVVFVAPDLRGRGASNTTSGPYGMAIHAADLEAVSTHFGLTDVLLLGHAMGGYVCEQFAAAHRDKARSMVLVDGGVAPEPLVDVDVQQYIETFLGPSLSRMQRTYESKEEYIDEWHHHPAFAETGVWNDAVENFVEYDVEEDGGVLRCRTSEQAVRDDFADGRFGTTTRSVAFQLTDLPIHLIWAEAGILNATPGLITPSLLAEYRDRLPQLEQTYLREVNHYTITLAEPGISAVVDVVTALL